MSLNYFKKIITTSFELEDNDVINCMYGKLKDRLGALLEGPTTANAADSLVEDTILNDQWKSCQSNRGLQIPKMAGR